MFTIFLIDNEIEKGLSFYFLDCLFFLFFWKYV